MRTSDGRFEITVGVSITNRGWPGWEERGCWEEKEEILLVVAVALIIVWEYEWGAWKSEVEQFGKWEKGPYQMSGFFGR